MQFAWQRVLVNNDDGQFLWASETGEKPFTPVDWEHFDGVPPELKSRFDGWSERGSRAPDEGFDWSAFDDEGRRLASELERALGIPVDYPA